MHVYRGELLIPNHYYKATVYFEGMGWWNYAWYTQRILWLLDGLSVGANWVSGANDIWYLHYHLKASGVSVMHSEIIDIIMSVYDRAQVIEIEDLEAVEPILTPDVPLPEPLKVMAKNWKLVAGVVLTSLALLVVLSYGYKKHKK